MTPEQAKQMLMVLLGKGRISMNGQPLSGEEIAQGQQAVLLLYERAKEKEEDETKEEKKSEPDNER